MNPEQEDFQQLRRLLALKRHEQPPPGYFEGFSHQIIVRIRAGEGLEQDTIAARFSWEVPWLQRLWSGLQAKPALAGAFGVLVCGLAISGTVLSEHAEDTQVTVVTSPGPQVPAQTGLVIAPLASGGGGGTLISSLNGGTDEPQPESLFEQIHRAYPMRMQPLLQAPLQAEPVSARIYLGQ